MYNILDKMSKLPPKPSYAKKSLKKYKKHIQNYIQHQRELAGEAPKMKINKKNKLILSEILDSIEQ